MPWIYHDQVPRDADTIQCECGGKANRVACTKQELKQFNCGRSYECCARAFVCEKCNKRTALEVPAPEMVPDWDFE